MVNIPPVGDDLSLYNRSSNNLALWGLDTAGFPVTFKFDLTFTLADPGTVSIRTGAPATRARALDHPNTLDSWLGAAITLDETNSLGGTP